MVAPNCDASCTLDVVRSLDLLQALETTLSNAIGGVAYVFERDAAGSWSHAAAVIPAPGEDTFADTTEIAFSANAQTLAISVASLTGPPHFRVEVY